jgi:tetratricopeptide (TPR) repeat protein
MNRSSKIVLLAGIVLSAISLIVVRLSSTPSAITWERDYEKALQRAAAENKPIIADMFTDWCTLCKQMDKETFAEPGLIKNMADDYVWLKLNTETEEDGIRLQKEFAILTYPTVLVLDSEGEELDRADRFLSSAPFQEAVRSSVNNPDSLATLRKSVRENPDSAVARYALADKLLRVNNFAKAGPEFQKVIDLDPENREGKTDLSHYNVALCLASQAKYQEALSQLDQLRKRFPRSGAVADATVLRGQIYHCCNMLDEAQAALREYAEKYPTQGHIEEVENLLATMEAESSGK